jgi:hypothetical protein
MSAMRCPKLAVLKADPLVGEALAPLIEACGITDADMPDIIRDDADYTDIEQLERDFPVVAAKLKANLEEVGVESFPLGGAT